MNVVSFFAGCGGLDLGFEKAGYNVVWANEFESSVHATYEKNHPDYEVIGGINADQFTLGFGSSILDSGKDFYNTQPYYPMIADQEGWFIMTSLPVNGAGNVLYLHTDGRSNPIERHKLNLNNGDKKILGPFL